jgi:L-lactate permease
MVIPSVILGTIITLAIMLYRHKKRDGTWHHIRGGLMRRYWNTSGNTAPQLTKKAAWAND